MDDLIIGANGGDPDGRDDAGEAYVLFGPLGSGTFEVSTTADVIINGIDAGDNLGLGATAAVDVNNDGTDDLILGSQRADPAGRTDAGETYVIFGPLTAGTLEMATAADITFNGIDTEDKAGGSVAGGDVNNDGKDDLLIGATSADPGGRDGAGESYVLYGPFVAGSYDLAVKADVIYNGIAVGDSSGARAVGDVNNDGVVDIIIGAPNADPGGRAFAGEVYVILGEVPDLSVTMSDGPDPAFPGPGYVVFYSLVVTNTGPVTATGVMLTDILPTGVAFDSASPGCQESGGTVTCNIGTLAPNASVDISIVGSFGAELSGTLTNNASVSGAETELVTSNNSVAEVTTISTAAPIPGVTQWGLIALMVLMAGAVAWRLRRRAPMASGD